MEVMSGGDEWRGKRRRGILIKSDETDDERENRTGILIMLKVRILRHILFIIGPASYFEF